LRIALACLALASCGGRPLAFPAAECRDGCPPTVLLSHQLPTSLAVDERFLYWTNLGPAGGEVRRANLDGTGEITLVAGQRDPQNLIVSHGALVWSDRSRVVTLGPTDAAPRVLADPVAATAIAAAGSDVFIADASSQALLRVGVGPIAGLVPVAFGLAADGARVYWLDGDSPTGGGALFAASYDGSAAASIVEHLGQPQRLAVGAHHLAFVADGVLWESALDGSARSRLTQTTISGLVFDSDALFWADGAGELHEDAGDAAHRLATGQEAPAAVAVEGNYVYWITTGSPDTTGAPTDGAIVRATRR
jgi:hypothetical protein